MTRYQLRTQHAALPLNEAELAELGLQQGTAIRERDLHIRANRSTREAIHAMLDQEEPDVLITVE